jgi:hypothetical protein
VLKDVHIHQQQKVAERRAQYLDFLNEQLLQKDMVRTEDLNLNPPVVTALAFLQYLLIILMEENQREENIRSKVSLT